MSDRFAYEVVTSRDGHSGLGIIEFEGRYHGPSIPLPNSSLFFTVQRVPKELHSRVEVLINNRFCLWPGDQTPIGSRTTEEEYFVQLSFYAIGQYLDATGMPPFTPSGTPVQIDANQTLQALHKTGRPQASDH